MYQNQYGGRRGSLVKDTTQPDRTFQEKKLFENYSTNSKFSQELAALEKKGNTFCSIGNMNSMTGDLAYLIFNAHDYSCLQKLRRILRRDSDCFNSLSKSMKESIETAAAEADKIEFAAYGPDTFAWSV